MILFNQRIQHESQIKELYAILVANVSQEVVATSFKGKKPQYIDVVETQEIAYRVKEYARKKFRKTNKLRVKIERIEK